MFECPICMEQGTDISTDISTTKCGHTFHTNCLVTYALYHSHQSTVQCPMCREPIGEQSDIMMQRQTDSWLQEIRRRRLPLEQEERRSLAWYACTANIVCFWFGIAVGVMLMYILAR
jgi:hypothetical protein